MHSAHLIVSQTLCLVSLPALACMTLFLSGICTLRTVTCYMHSVICIILQAPCFACKAWLVACSRSLLTWRPLTQMQQHHSLKCSSSAALITVLCWSWRGCRLTQRHRHTSNMLSDNCLWSRPIGRRQRLHRWAADPVPGCIAAAGRLCAAFHLGHIWQLSSTDCTALLELEGLPADTAPQAYQHHAITQLLVEQIWQAAAFAQVSAKLSPTSVECCSKWHLLAAVQQLSRMIFSASLEWRGCLLTHQHHAIRPLLVEQIECARSSVCTGGLLALIHWQVMLQQVYDDLRFIWLTSCNCLSALTAVPC